MRRLSRNRAREEEEESVFVTMTDMTISFLLIIMILLAFFATQLKDDETVPLSAFEALRQDRDALSIENKNLRITIEEQRRELTRLTSELESVTVERNQLQEKLDQLSDENEALRARLAELEIVNKQLRDKLDRLSAENETMRARLADLEVENARVGEELDRLRIENQTLRVRLADLEIANAQLRNELEGLRAEIERLRAEVERLREVNPLEAYLSQAIEQRREILVELRHRLLIEFPELQVVISPEQDALRFQGEGLFRSGSSQLQPRQRRIVQTMGRLLDDILVCFTLGPRATRGPDCESGNALIEAVQIEGHTDSDGSDETNLRLSTDRANATLLVMLNENRAILAHQNLRDQPVMSVSGYGEMRRIDRNEETSKGKAANRRIDLRIIMYAPSTVKEVEEVGRRLDTLRSVGGEK